MQGTAADLIKKRDDRDRRLAGFLRLKSKLVLQVHDELVLEVPGPSSKRCGKSCPG